jgi:hypothetical protein
MYIDTQLIRNAYLQRRVEQIDLPFGEFACVYLNVDDTWLAHEHNISQACTYILKQGYNDVPDPNQVALNISMSEA